MLKPLTQKHCNSSQPLPTQPAVTQGILPTTPVLFQKLTKARVQVTNAISQWAKTQEFSRVSHCIGTAPNLQSLLPYSGNEKSNGRGWEPKRNWYVQKEEKEKQEKHTVHHHLVQP